MAGSGRRNADLCESAGRFFCFYKGNWTRGLPLLAKGKGKKGIWSDYDSAASSIKAAIEKLAAKS